MKYLFLILALLGQQTASARIGETIEQCDKRYGKPIAFQDAQGALVTPTRIYRKGDFEITVFQLNGRCEAMMYTNIVTGKLLSTEIMKFLEANGRGWDLFEGRKDAFMCNKRTLANIVNESLQVTSAKMNKYLFDQEAKSTRNRTKGF